jgi:hypothetical protein
MARGGPDHDGAGAERVVSTAGPARTGATPGLPSARTLRLVLGAAIASTLVHYTDNLVNIEDYPQPHWINEAVIPIVWALLTAAGIGAYALFRRERYVAAGVGLLVYSYAGLSSLGHYPYGAASDFSLKMHAGILLDGLTGAAVLVVAVWVLVRGRGDTRRVV